MIAKWWLLIIFTCACSVAKLCLNLCDPMDCSPPGSPVHEILQARILEWVAISYSRGSSWPRDRAHISCVSHITGRLFTTESPGKSLHYVAVATQSLSCVQLCVAPQTVAHRAPLFMGFPRQEYWSGLPFPTPGDLPDPGIKPAFSALASRFFTTAPPRKPRTYLHLSQWTTQS